MRRPVSRERLRWIGGVALAVLATAALALQLGPGRGGGGDGADDEALPPYLAKSVRGIVRKMSLEDKVDAVLLLGFDGQDATAPMVGELQRRQLGGVLVAKRNWTDQAQGGALIGELKAAARSGGRIPPLFVTSQEGGPYRDLPDLPPAEREIEIGDRGSASGATAWARQTGTALRTVGIDANMAPVADVATIDSPIADRAFSDDPAVVAEMTAAAVRGCRAARIACALKHFPGAGTASQDTDEGPATVSLDRPTFEQRDLEVFRTAFSERAPAVVLSHAFFASYDPVTPASLAPDVATDLLRGKLGFRGVAISDDLEAGAVSAPYSVGEAAVAALQAGSDLLLIGTPGPAQGRARAAVLKAARSGELPRARLNEAVGRVLQLKLRQGILPRGR